MKYENLRNLRETKNHTFADVDAVTWYGKRKTVVVFRPFGSSYWRDINSGQWLDDRDIDKMERAFIARKEMHEGLL